MARSDPTRLMTVRRRQLSLGVVPLISLAFAAPIGASESVPFASDSGWLDPTEIDRAVRSFTGADIGEVGGARARADNRLRLAICAAPLATSWHGTRQAAVKVECARTQNVSGPWRIFVATLPAEQSLAPSRAARSAPPSPLVKRGDPITVIVRGRGFTVQQAGEAIENGQIGDWIGVRTARQADPVRARIERPGLAVIPSE